jgi:hypothetical protein
VIIASVPAGLTRALFCTPRFESISTDGNIFLTSSQKAAGVLSRNYPSRVWAGAIEYSFNIDLEKCRVWRRRKF